MLSSGAILADVGVARQAPYRRARAAKRRHGGNKALPHGELRFFAARASPDRLENERHEGASGRQLLIASWTHRPRSGDREIQCMLGTGRSHCNLAISSLSCSFRRFISANFNSSLAGYTNSFAISLSSAS